MHLCDQMIAIDAQGTSRLRVEPAWPPAMHPLLPFKGKALVTYLEEEDLYFEKRVCICILYKFLHQDDFMRTNICCIMWAVAL